MMKYLRMNELPAESNRYHHGVRHSSFFLTSKIVNRCSFPFRFAHGTPQRSMFGIHITSVFDVPCSVFGVHFSSAYKYDFNGNITELERYAGVDKIDDLEYYYDHGDHTAKLDLSSNRLYLVDEQSTHPGGNDLKSGTKTGAGFDRNDPTSWNYHYDPIGNLIKDVNDSIDLITWTVTGKVSDVIFASSKDDLAFRYDPMGNRIAKIQKPKGWVDEEEWTITWYARDAQGNVLAVYNKAMDSLNFRATEFNIYGSSRIGMVTSPEQLNETPQVPMALSQTLGLKVYEFSNHLGNVLTTFSDRKIATEGASGYGAYYNAEILSSTDYYPFGFEMPGRSYTGDGYRYGFQGQEDDPELKGKGNSSNFKYRMHDPRIGRFFAVDPIWDKYPELTPYQFAFNNVIWYSEIEGLEGSPTNTFSFSEYQAKLEVTYGPLTLSQINVLKRGCIGITSFHLGITYSPPLTNSYGTLAIANIEAEKIRQDITNNPQNYPAAAHVVIFSKRFWTSDNTSFLPNASGQVDMSSYNYAPRPSDATGGYTNFDYGYLDPNTGLWTHANHCDRCNGHGSMEVYESTLAYYSRPLLDFNRQVFGVLVSTLAPASSVLPSGSSASPPPGTSTSPPPGISPSPPAGTSPSPSAGTSPSPSAGTSPSPPPSTSPSPPTGASPSSPTGSSSGSPTGSQPRSLPDSTSRGHVP
jgi:RHS repeat-associated protein